MKGGVANSVGTDENSKLNRHYLNKEKTEARIVSGK